MAGSIALGLFERNPDHPGAAHYIIHAFDDPVHAPLPCRRRIRFAEIAAAVSHARHMPSHIFIQRGMWSLVSKSNDSAYEAAVALWDPGVRVGDMVHALDWGQYGDLQRGDYAKAKEWIAELDDLIERTGDTGRGKSTAPLVRARYIVETEQWETREINEDTVSSELLATGISRFTVATWSLPATLPRGSRRWAPGRRPTGRPSSAEPNPPRCAPRTGGTDSVGRGGRRRCAQAVRRGSGDRLDNGAAARRRVADQAIRELYGEALLQLERPEDAIAQFDDQLLYTPNRPRSLGLARAHAAAGDAAAAAEMHTAS